MVDNLVVQCAAAFGMGTADQRSKRRMGHAFVDHRFQSPSGAGQIHTAHPGWRRNRADTEGCNSGSHSTHDSTPKRELFEVAKTVFGIQYVPKYPRAKSFNY